MSETQRWPPFPAWLVDCSTSGSIGIPWVGGPELGLGRGTPCDLIWFGELGDGNLQSAARGGGGDEVEGHSNNLGIANRVTVAGESELAIRR